MVLHQDDMEGNWSKTWKCFQEKIPIPNLTSCQALAHRLNPMGKNIIEGPLSLSYWPVFVQSNWTNNEENVITWHNFRLFSMIIFNDFSPFSTHNNHRIRIRRPGQLLNYLLAIIYIGFSLHNIHFSFSSDGNKEVVLCQT